VLNEKNKISSHLFSNNDMLFNSGIFHVDSNNYQYKFVFLLLPVALLIVSVNGSVESESMEFVAEYNLTDTTDGHASSGFEIADIVYLPDNEHVVLTGTSKNLWNIQDKTYLDLQVAYHHSNRIAYDPESNRLAITCVEVPSYPLRIINMNSEPPSHEFINNSGVDNWTYMGNVIFGENSSIVYTADSKKVYRWERRMNDWFCNGTADLYDGHDGIKALFFDDERMELIAVIRNGDCILLGTDLSIDRRINFTGMARPNRDYSSPLKPICYLKNHTVVWTRDDIIFFNLTTGIYSTVSLVSNINSPLLVPSHNGKWIAIVNYGAVAIYDLNNFSRITYFLATAKISAVCWSYDDTRIATVDYNGVAQIWINIKDPGYNRRPQIDIEYPIDGQTVNNTILVRGNATDDHEITSVVYRIDDSSWTITNGSSKWGFIWDTRYLSNGYHRIAVRAFDGDLYSHLDIVNVNVQNNDTSMVPPVITIDLPNEGQVVSGQVTFTGRVMGPNKIRWVRLLFDNESRIAYIAGSHWFISIDTRILSDSVMTFSAIAHDGILNSTPAQINISIQNTPGDINSTPWVMITSPQEGVSISGLLTIKGTAHDPEDKLRFVMIRVDEDPWIYISPTSEWEHHLNSWDLENGQHRLLAFCMDDIQSSEITTLVFNVSNDWEFPFGKPICMIQSPPNGSRVNGTISIRGIAIDDFSIMSVWLSINEEDPQRVNGTYQWEYELETTGLENGMIGIACWASDGRNDSFRVQWYLTVDNNVRPYCQIVWPTNGSVVDGLINIVGIAEDEDNIVAVRYSIEDGMVADAIGTAEWTFQVNTLDYDNGNVTIEVWASDSTEESIHVVLTLIIKNNQPPTCVIRNPSNGQTIRTDIEINGSAFDPDGDNIVVELRIDNGSWVSCNGGINWTYLMSINNLSPGVHIVYSRSNDGQTYSTIDSIDINIVEKGPSNNSSPDDRLDLLIYILLILVVIIASFAILIRQRRHRVD
jgi:hypothetical protein